jgi:hypothetical protein
LPKNIQSSHAGLFFFPRFLVLLALLVVLISTCFAYAQAPRPNPFQSVTPLTLDWWRYPIETSAFKRLPVIPSILKSIFVLPGTSKLRAVGYSGMIVHSDDSGQTWERQPISLQSQSEKLPPSTSLPSPIFGLAQAVEPDKAQPPIQQAPQQQPQQ